MTQRKAVALISGGLDSLLAAKLIIDQGIHVEGLNFYSGFFGAGSSLPSPKQNNTKVNYNSPIWIADQLKIKLHVIDVVEDFKKTLITPHYGYGAHLNPCLDCKIFIVKKSLEWIHENNFDFIISGEVIGQRPMSQLKHMMPIVCKRSEAEGLLLRPLCAKLLEPSIPEKENWVDRNQLLDISGRGRKRQIALAKKSGFEHFPQPAGGCLLTEKKFAGRLSDYWRALNKKDYDRDTVDLLKTGRHLRPKQNFKIIIGRDEEENLFLEKFTERFTHLHSQSHFGPTVIIDGNNLSEDDFILAAQITARFGRGRNEENVDVTIYKLNEKPFEITVKPFQDEEALLGFYI